MKIAILMAIGITMPMTSLAAQRLSPSAFAATPAAVDTPRAPVRTISATDTTGNAGAMAFTGILAGAVGAFVGGAVGYSTRSCHFDDWFCGMGEMFVGGIIGEVLLLPYGVHMNGKRTTLAAKTGMSALIAAIGLVAAVPTDGAALLAVPPAQLIALIMMERSGQ